LYFSVSPCNNNPCENGATCSVSGGGAATCACLGSWGGATCTGKYHINDKNNTGLLHEDW